MKTNIINKNKYIWQQYNGRKSIIINQLKKNIYLIIIKRMKIYDIEQIEKQCVDKSSEYNTHVHNEQKIC